MNATQLLVLERTTCRRLYKTHTYIYYKNGNGGSGLRMKDKAAASKHGPTAYNKQENAVGSLMLDKYLWINNVNVWNWPVAAEDVTRTKHIHSTHPIGWINTGSIKSLVWQGQVPWIAKHTKIRRMLTSIYNHRPRERWQKRSIRQASALMI